MDGTADFHSPPCRFFLSEKVRISPGGPIDIPSLEAYPLKGLYSNQSKSA